MSGLRRALALLAAASAASACGEHLQEEGRYAFTATEVLLDQCGLVPTPESLWDGTLRKDGEYVVIQHFELLDLTLYGEFRDVSEEFYADGSAANAWVTVRGEQCLVDTATVQLDARAEATGAATATAFTGAIGVRYESVEQERCRCQLSALYRAERTDG